MIDLPPGDLALVKSILRDHVPERRILAFGSRVMGMVKAYSDLDLCLMGDTPLELNRLAHLEEAFSESTLPIKVDIVSWASLTEFFRRIIEENSVIIQEAQA